MEIELGSTVVNRQLGTPFTGVAVCVMTGEYWLNTNDSRYREACPWDAAYPDWREKPVVIVRLPKPIKAVRREELSPDLDYDTIPTTLYVVQPLDDLAPLEDCFEEDAGEAG